MTTDEFDRWLHRYCVLFPETTEWMGRIEDDRRAEILEAWAKLLSEVEYRDVVAATEKMFAGDEPAFPALGVMFGDREKTASHARKLARQVRTERMAAAAKRKQARELAEARMQHGATRYRYSMGQLYRSILEMHEAGDPHAGRKMRAMADELPHPGEEGYRPVDGYHELFEKGR